MASAEIALKSPEDIRRIAECGRILADIFTDIGTFDLEYTTAWEIDSYIESRIVKKRARPAFKTIPGYGYASCVSVNNEVVHGIPFKSKKFVRGDIVKIDIGAALRGYFTDACRALIVGHASETAVELVDAARRALAGAVSLMVPGNRIGDLGYSIMSAAESAGFAVVSHLSGHGTGFSLHEPPMVPNSGVPSSGMLLVPGMVLALEPIVNQGSSHILRSSDGWTVVTADGMLSAHCEDTVAVTEAGPLVLTA